MTPQAFQNLQKQLVTSEDVRLSAYRDNRGYLTIGVGRLIDSRLGGGISKEEAFYLLGNDIAACEEDCLRAFTWFKDLEDVRQRVVLEMRFNLGLTKLLKFVKTLKLIETGDYRAAATEMLQSKWSTQVGARAVRLAEMMKTGCDV